MLPGAQLLLALLWLPRWEKQHSFCSQCGCYSHHKNNKDDFFCMGGSWLPLESDSIQPLLASCSLLGEKDMGEEGCLPFLQIHSPALEHSQGA